MVTYLETENSRIKGVIDEVSLKRDEDRFSSFNLKLGLVVKTDKTLTYEQGERLIKRFKKELLGRKVEIIAIIVPCPICGKGFNTEQGMRQHVRMVHEKKQKEKTEKPKEKKAKSTRKKPSKRKTSKRTSAKK